MSRFTTIQMETMMRIKNPKMNYKGKMEIKANFNIRMPKLKNNDVIFANDNSIYKSHSPFLLDFGINSNCYNKFGKNVFTNKPLFDNSIQKELKKNKYVLNEAKEINGVEIKTLAAKNNVLKIDSDGLYRINMINGEKSIITAKKTGNSVNLIYQSIDRIRGIDVYDYQTSSGFIQKNSAYYAKYCEDPLFSDEGVRLQPKYGSLLYFMSLGVGMTGNDMGLELGSQENKEILKSMGFDLKNNSITIIIGNNGRTYHFDENENYLYSEDARNEDYK